MAENEPSVFVIERECDEKGMRVTNFDKWLIAGVIGAIFFVLSLPFMYKLTNTITRVVKINTVSKAGVPTFVGLLIHVLVFVILVRLLMH